MKRLLTFILLLAAFPVQAGPSQAGPSQAGPFSYFKNRSWDFFPIPVIESRPDEGLTFGLMPVAVMTDKEDKEIKAILGAVGQYNSVTKIGGAGIAYFFPEADQEIQIYFELAQKYSREVTLRYYNPTLKDDFFVDAEFSHLKSPFGRFFGIGPTRTESDGSNFVSRHFKVDVTGGYNLANHLRPAMTVRFHTTDILTRAVDDLEDTLTLYGGLPNVVDSTNIIWEPSLTFDNRKDGNYSKKGILASAGYFLSSQSLGSDNNFMGWKAEAIHLWPLIDGRLTQATRVFGQQVFGTGTPFYELSSLGGPEEMRSFVPGRFVDKGKIGFQVEERIKLFGMSMFGNSFEVHADPFFELARVYDDFSNLGLNHWQPVAGVGFRLFVPPNVIGRLDVAVGSDGFEIYTALGYPF